MGFALRAATLSPLQPVVDALAGMRGRYPVHGLVPGLTVDDPRGWTPASELVGDGPALDAFLAAAGRRWQAPPHVAAALAWKCYAYWVALPAVLGYATAGRVPLPDPERVLLRWSEHAPFLTASLYEPLIVGNADDDALRRAIRVSLLDAHVAPLVDRIHDRLRLGRRTLLGSLASGIAHGLSRAAGSLRGPALPLAGNLLSTLDIADLVQLSELPDGRLYVQRRTCCLAFTLPEPRICEGCCIAPRR
jgi:hypothetical protein